MRLGAERIRTIGEMRTFLDGSEGADFRLMDREKAYDFVSRTLRGSPICSTALPPLSRQHTVTTAVDKM